MRRLLGWAVTTGFFVLFGEPVMGQEPTPLGDQFQANTATAYNNREGVAMPLPSGEFVVVWEDLYYDVPFGVHARRFSSDGSPAGDQYRLEDLNAVRDVATDANGNSVVLGIRSSDIAGIRFDPSGQQVGGFFQIADPATSNVLGSHPAIAMNSSGDFVVAWEDCDVKYLLGCTRDVAARTFDPLGNPISDTVFPNSAEPRFQTRPSVTMKDDGDFVVVWTRVDNSGDGSDALAARYALDGTQQGAAFLVPASTLGSQVDPKVASNSAGEWVVVWADEGLDGSSWGIFGQEFQPDGSRIGGEFMVNSFTTGSQRPTDIAAVAGGGFVVTWSGAGPEAGFWDLSACFLDDDGVPVGSDFAIRSSLGTPPALSSFPKVSSFASGKFVVVWGDHSGQGYPISDSGEVWARQFRSPYSVFADGFESGDTSSWSSSQ